MASRNPGIPAGHFPCQWCKTAVAFDGDGGWPDRCPQCGMHPHPGKVDETVGGKVDPTTAKTAFRNRKHSARQAPLATVAVGMPVLGVDPGARYTGVVLRDGDVALLATTLVRDVEQNAVDWARLVVELVREIHFTSCPVDTPVAIEGVAAPKGFKNGVKAPINPAPILFAGVVLGGLAIAWPSAVIIAPGGNGSQHITNYPPDLVGRRPAGLPGSSNQAGTRAHEQSAYDVAGKAALIYYPAQRLDLSGTV